MFDRIDQIQKIRQAAQDPRESELVRALTTILSTLEYRQLRAVEGLHEALDVDGVDVQGDREQREQQLLDMVDAIASGAFQQWWFEDVAAGHLSNPDDARAYAGLDDEEWQDQIARWADTYRSKAADQFEGKTDREVAAQHVYRKFDVSIREFEREVVQWNRKEAMRTILAGNFEAVDQGIRAATSAAQQADVDDEADDGGAE